MHHRFALLDVLFQHAKRVAAERLEILLDFHLDVWRSQPPAQLVAISAELI
jgi:hypothetical protein